MSVSRLYDQLLLLVLRLPLCTTHELARLADVHPVSVRRLMARLIREQLVVAEKHRPPARGCRRFRPTRRGLVHAAGMLAVPASVLARRYGHSERALRRLRNRLERTTAARAVFLALTEACRETRADGIAARLGPWWAPARAGCVRLDGLGTLTLDCWTRTIGVCLDIPCLAPHHLVPRLRAAGAALQERSEPVLIVFVSPEQRRARLVRSILDTLYEEQGGPPVPLAVVRAPEAASALVAGLAARAGPPRKKGNPLSGADGPGTLGLLPRSLTLSAEARVARHRARLRMHDVMVLDALADHPCQSLSNLCQLLGISPAVARRLVRRLVEAGLVVPLPTRPARLALASGALELLAERDGLAPKTYQRARGIMTIQPQGGGVAHVLKYLPHGVGADAFFRLLMQHARWRTAQGYQEALVAWEGPATCHRRFRYEGRWRSVRPDGFGVYRAGEVDHPFHLEWDRGTLRRQHHLRKLAAYRAYVEARAFMPDRAQPPTLLYVFSRPDLESRTLQLAREVFEELPEMPILLTSRWRLKKDGPAGRIWTSPFAAGRGAWWCGPAAGRK